MTSQNDEVSNPIKKPWESMSLAYVAHVSEIVLGGAGKESIPSADPGEPLKCPPGIFNKGDCVD